MVLKKCQEGGDTGLAALYFIHGRGLAYATCTGMLFEV